MNEPPIPAAAPTAKAATDVTKRAFTVLGRDGRTPLVARIPTHLTVGQATAEIAAYSGFPQEPSVSTRYALLATDGGAGGNGGNDFLLLRDDQTFGEIAEHSVLRIAPQPRPA